MATAASDGDGDEEGKGKGGKSDGYGDEEGNGDGGKIDGDTNEEGKGEGGQWRGQEEIWRRQLGESGYGQWLRRRGWRAFDGGNDGDGAKDTAARATTGEIR
jgi:hypothetical protein